MPPAARKPRTYDPAAVRSGLIAQVESVRLAAHALTPDQLARASGLPGWDVHRLVLHIAGQIEALPVLLAEPAPRVAAPEAGLGTWMAATAAGRADAELLPGEAGAGGDAAAAVDAAVEQLEPVLEQAVRTDVLLPHPLGAMRALDFTVTRLVELVVHSDDLVRATGVRVTPARRALAATVRVLADALAAKAPGSAVEVRIPPFAVVQCGRGPRHTRGTPPNVVETDPLTWIRLATGRIGWQQALDAAHLTASGERADLRAHLPVLG